MAGTDDTQAVTPLGLGRAIAKKARRDFTFVIAAGNSLHKEEADFICTGEADHLIIQQALDALPPQGGKLVFQEGIYLLNRQERPYQQGQAISLLETAADGIILEGLGAGTILRLADNCLEPGIILAMLRCSGNEIQIRNLTFDGNRAFGNEQGEAEALGFAASAAHVQLANCQIKQWAGRGISNGAAHFKAAYCKIEGCNTGLYNFGPGMSLTHTAFLDNLVAGGVLASCSGFQLQGNYFEGNKQLGIFIDGASNGLLLGNMIIGSKEGLKLSDSSNCNVQSNYIRRNAAGGSYAAGEHALYLAGCQDCQVLLNDCLGKGVEEDAQTQGTLLSFSGTDWNRA